ncbi:UDP-N-acetylmuramoyl-L-alanine--D-glutamate ligase [Sporosarcina sp. CAU 1771]
MKDVEQFSGKKILVLGLAKSGYAAAKLLHSLGAEVTVNDFSPEEGNAEAIMLRTDGVHVICGGHPEGILDEGFELIVKNPGIPYSNPVVQNALQKGIPIWTEVEITSRVSEAPIIAITGSNGKTTTTTILHHMLKIAKKNPLIAGNIGTVSCSVVEKATKEEIIVLEVSSFQLMGTEQFRPRIAIWTNVYDSHLDYHGSSAEYIKAKAQITANQNEDDFIIYNADQTVLREVVSQSKAVKIPFTLKGRQENGISADDTQIYWNGEPYVDRSIIKIPGQHNLENIVSATAAAILSGCDKSAIEHVLKSFTGVKHRMQFVKESKGRQFYNDSKATNTLATKSALASFTAPVVLLLGGLDRGHSFEELRPYMGNVKAVITLGETKEKVEQFASSCGVQTIIHSSTMGDAVKKANTISVDGDVVLLSPACASWDEYTSFEVRGDAFIEAVFSI